MLLCDVLHNTLVSRKHNAKFDHSTINRGGENQTDINDLDHAYLGTAGEYMLKPLSGNIGVKLEISIHK